MHRLYKYSIIYTSIIYNLFDNITFESLKSAPEDSLAKTHKILLNLYLSLIFFSVLCKCSMQFTTNSHCITDNISYLNSQKPNHTNVDNYTFFERKENPKSFTFTVLDNVMLMLKLRLFSQFNIDL